MFVIYLYKHSCILHFLFQFCLFVVPTPFCPDNVLATHSCHLPVIYHLAFCSRSRLLVASFSCIFAFSYHLHNPILVKIAYVTAALYNTHSSILHIISVPLTNCSLSIPASFSPIQIIQLGIAIIHLLVHRTCLAILVVNYQW